MKKNKKLVLLQLALKRDDGKVEVDNFFTERMLTREEVVDMSTKFRCGVIVSYVGDVTLKSDEFSKEHTIVVDLPAPVKVGEANG